MTAPIIQSVQYAGTTLYIIFDRAVYATPGQELDGFTATRTPGGVEALSYVSISNNAIIATLAGAILLGETLEIDYVSGSGNVVDAATQTDPAPSFTIEAVAYFDSPLAIRAIVGEGGNDLINVYFNQPIGSISGDLKLGFTIEVNDVALDLTSATVSLNEDATVLTFDTGSNFVYNDVVDVDYDASIGDLVTWPAAALVDFSFDAIPNISTDGLPDSQYPLSWVTSYTVTVVDKVATGTLGVSLNPIDIKLVQEYGPLRLITGGTFGITMSNPLGLDVVGKTVYIIDGLLFDQQFIDPAQVVVNAVNAAKDWQTKMIAKIAVLLGQARATDQGIVFNNQQVNPV